MERLVVGNAKLLSQFRFRRKHSRSRRYTSQLVKALAGLYIYRMSEQTKKYTKKVKEVTKDGVTMMQRERLLTVRLFTHFRERREGRVGPRACHNRRAS